MYYSLYKREGYKFYQSARNFEEKNLARYITSYYTRSREILSLDEREKMLNSLNDRELAERTGTFVLVHRHRI